MRLQQSQRSPMARPMTFEEFNDELALSTGAWYRRMVGLIGSAMIALALLTFFAAPTLSLLDRNKSVVMVLTLVIPMALIFSSLAISQVSNWYWNRRSRERFQCRNCGKGITVQQAQIVATHNICPHCNAAMFPCQEVGEIVRVDESEVLRPPRPEEPTTDDPAGAEENPYAPPVESQPTAGLQNQRNGCLWLLPNYFIVSWQAIGHLTRGRQYSLDQMNQLMDSFGGAPIADRYADGVVAGLQRRSVIWLLLTVFGPLFATLLFLITQPNAIRHWVALLFFAIGVYTIAAALGAIGFAMLLNLSPAPLKRFIQGGTPAIISEEDEKTGVYGIMFWFADAAGATFQQPNIKIRYRCNHSGVVTFGLLDRDSLREYRLTRELAASDDWQDAAIDFAPSLQVVAPEFRGDEIRLLPPRDMMVEVETFQIHLPQLV